MSDLELALLVAAASLIGAAVGGVISGATTVWIESRRATREGEREDDAARAVARVLYQELFRAEWTLNTCLLNHCWWPEHVTLTPRLDEASRLGLASRLPADHWYMVLMGTSALEVADIDRSMAPSDIGTQVPDLPPDRAEGLRETRLKVREARRALADFAGVADVHEEAASRPITRLDASS